MRRGVPILVAVLVASAAVLVADRSDPVRDAHAAQPTSSATQSVGGDIVRYQRLDQRVDRPGRANNCHAVFGSGPPPNFTLPTSSGPYVATLTVSFGYRTVGAMPDVVIRPGVVSPHTQPMTTATVLPAGRPVPPTDGRPSSATLVVRLSQLSGGIDYAVFLQPVSSSCHLDDRGHLVAEGVTITQVIYSLHYWTS